MTVLKYKDYQGSVCFDDGRLLIRVLHIDDFLTTECDSASQAHATFAELIDDYLETCAELGKEPSKPFKGSFNVRMTPELHRKAAMAAADHDESLNAWVVESVEQRISGRNWLVEVSEVWAKYAFRDSSRRKARPVRNVVQPMGQSTIELGAMNARYRAAKERQTHHG
jgi:predicted HicB family RNase H-like nuclease